MRLWEKVYIDGAEYGRGDLITIDDQVLRVLDMEWRSIPSWCRVVVTRHHHHIGLFLYRVGESLRFTAQYITIVLNVWGLAKWDPATIPTWRDVHLLRRLADAWARHKNKEIP